MKVILLIFIIIAVSSCVPTENLSRFSDAEIQTVDIYNSKLCNISAAGVNKINLNKGVGTMRIKQSDLIDTIIFLPLETTEESVFGYIDKLLMSDDRIIIKDGDGRFLIFDDKGNFISKSIKGNGPGEINKLWDIAFDDKRQYIIAYQSDHLSYFDKNGNFIEKKRSPIMFKEFCTKDSGFVFYQDQFINYHLGKEADNAILLSDGNFAVYGKGARTCPFSLVSSRTNIQKNCGLTLVSPILNDTIYEIISDGIKAKYIIEYDKQKTKLSSVDDIKTSDKFYYMGCMFENSKTQLFEFWSYKHGLCFTFHDKWTNNVVGGTIISNNENELPLCLGTTLTVHNDYFVSYNTPYNGMHFNSSIVADLENKKVEKLNDDDNAVLIFYKIKTIQ